MFEIVIAEDNQADVTLLREALEVNAVPCAIRVFENGSRLLRYLDEAGSAGGPPCPDLVILDWHLPQGEGPTIIRKVAAHMICEATPVMVLTSSASPRDRRAAIEAGADLYIEKPSSLDDFLDLGRIVLGQLKDRRN